VIPAAIKKHKVRRRLNVPTNQVVPETPILTKQTYASPMSYVGSTRRILRWGRKDRPVWAQVLAWAGAVLGILLAWTFLAGWYVIIFGVFGIFAIPYRLHRRNQRKELHLQRTQLATMQAMMAGQMKQAD
jgi:hypothetical protein